MTTIVKNLVWKEFHELKSSVIAATAILVSISVCYAFRDHSDRLTGANAGFWAYPLLAGVFFGMRAAAGERSNRSAVFIASLPVSHRVLGAVRLLATLCAAIVPLALLLALAAALAYVSDAHAMAEFAPLPSAFGWSVLGTAFCLSAAAIAGLGQSTEIRAGAMGLAGILVAAMLLWVAFWICADWLDGGLAEPRHAARLAVSGGTSLLLLAAAGFSVVFVTWYSRALGPFTDPGLNRWSWSLWRPAAIPAPIAALLWKGWREMGVLGVQVFVIALFLSTFAGALGYAGHEPTSATALLTRGLPAVLWVGGFVLAVLVGVGAVIGDVQGGVNTFWRSRPISAQSWYWTKYGIGLATILLAIEVPFWLTSGSAPGFIDSRGALWWPLTWNVVFSFALTATCLVRQPAQAAILAIGAAGILYALVEAIFGSFAFGESSTPLAILASVFAAALVGSTLLGAWAAERDAAIS
jgi:hypothetical protein